MELKARIILVLPRNQLMQGGIANANWNYSLCEKGVFLQLQKCCDLRDRLRFAGGFRGLFSWLSYYLETVLLAVSNRFPRAVNERKARRICDCTYSLPSMMQYFLEDSIFEPAPLAARFTE